MSDIQLEQYYDRFDPADHYSRVLFRADRTLQSAELNEVQRSLLDRVKGIGDAILSNGDIVRDCRVSINEATGEVVCESGALYLEGAVRGVPAATFFIPTTGTVAIGVYLRRRVVTEFEDPGLYNPAVGTRGEGEGGAARLQEETAWGYSTDGQTGDFYPIYTVDNGALRAKEPPPNLDSVTQALARYDRDSAGGTYIVSGLRTLMAAGSSEAGQQVYTVSEGRARVYGYPVELTVSRRLTKAATPDLLAVDSEPHLSAGPQAQRLVLDRYPVGAIQQIRITKESTETITHGGYTGAADPLPHTSVVEILEVKQGGITYTPGADYRLTAGKVDWSPAGLEPAPHSAYTVTYRHIAQAVAQDADLQGCTVEGAVANTQILVTYTQMLPRYDRLCLTRDGEFLWIDGVASEWNPQPPRVPDDMLALATVHQTWDSARTVRNDGVKTVPMDDIAALNTRMDGILAEVAAQRLTADIITREAGAKRGLWVDPCLGDDMRDQGLAQTAAIVNGVITLPVGVDVVARMAQDVARPLALQATYVPVLEQLLRTGAMLVNPYSAFEPLPALVQLSPAIDRWTDVQTQWASPVTELFNTGHFVPGNPNLTLVDQTSSTQAQVVAAESTRLQYLRQLAVGFQGAGFAAGETVDVTFDGLPVATAQADAAGALAGTFTIPANVPAGSKQVLFAGRGGSRGSAIFSGQGQLTLQTLRNVTTTVLTWHDPLAQTFVLDAACQLAAVDVWFTAAGTSRVVVQIRETTVGMPNQTVLAEQILDPADLVLGNNATRVEFPAPVMLQPGMEYALVVMCDDGVTALAIAELGKSDPWYSTWVTSQPYQVGVLLSSSNASTWTAHQDKDLTFRLLKAVFSEASRLVPLGQVEVDGATDLMLMGVAEQPAAACRVEYAVTLPDAAVVTLTDQQPARFAQPLTGALAVAARLSGSAQASPVLHPGAQLVAGVTAQTADYITRAVPAGQDSRVRVILDAFLPAGAAVLASLGDGEHWTPVPFLQSSPLDEGWQELTYEGTTGALLIRVKLELTGTPVARPMVTNVRVLTI
ncbi:DUF4815 domain-containing protein [Megalodesulfovibrio paquesii]